MARGCELSVHSEDVAATAKHLRIISRVHSAFQAIHEESERLLFPFCLDFCHWNNAYHVALEIQEKLNQRKQFNKINGTFVQIKETFTFLNLLINAVTLLFLRLLAGVDLSVEVKHNKKSRIFSHLI